MSLLLDSSDAENLRAQAEALIYTAQKEAEKGLELLDRYEESSDSAERNRYFEAARDVISAAAASAGIETSP